MNKQRREIIQKILNSQPFTTFKELEARFPKLSSMTIRRDIDWFQTKGEVIKVRGGARSVKYMITSMDDTFENRVTENTFAKRQIAARAAEFAVTGKTLFFDSGTTMMALAGAVANVRLNITTNCPQVAIELLKHPNAVINLIGGTLNREDYSLCGLQANKYVDGTEFDVAFIAPTGFSEYNGFTGGNWAECDLKKRIVKRSEKVVMLFDSSKVNKSMPYTFAQMKDISVIISEKPLPESMERLALENGVEVIVAE